APQGRRKTGRRRHDARHRLIQVNEPGAGSRYQKIGVRARIGCIFILTRFRTEPLGSAQSEGRADMSYKTILAILDTPENTDIAANFALALAAEHDAHVIGMHAEVISAVPLVVPMEIPDPVAVQALQDMARAEARDVEQRFRKAVQAKSTSFEW